MASQSLYRKWRSQTFADLVGQEAIVRTLLNAVRDGRLAHAYLFSGPRGTGKTSVARLLAKAVNCEQPHDGEPCNVCSSCQEITAGRSPDVIEIDAASNNGVDDIRKLRETASLMGSGGRYKVYVVDEVHMLSTSAFNALLKTLEEPPPHVIFVLATTEFHKVLPTVVSRCQPFYFRRFRMTDIVARLKHVAAGEGLALEPAAADLLARAAQGGMRDALSLLDQAVAFCGERVDLERTRAMLGLADVGSLRRIISAVAEERAADALDLLNELVTGGADIRQLNSQFAEEWRALMLASAGADLTRVMDYTEEEAHELASLAGRFSLDELMACARFFARNEGPARGLPVPQLALEISLLECLRVRRHDAQQPSVGASQSVPQTQQPSRLTPASPTPRPAQPVAAAPRPALAEELDLAAIDEGTWSGPSNNAPTTRSASSPAPSRAPISPPAAAEPTPSADVMRAESVSASGDEPDWVAEAQRNWALIRKICRQKPPMGAVVAGLLSAVELARADPGTPVTLHIRTKFEVHLNKLREPGMREVVEWALEQALGVPFKVQFIPPGATPRTPAPTRQSAVTDALSDAAGVSGTQPAAIRQTHVYEGSASAPLATPTTAAATNGHHPASAHAPRATDAPEPSTQPTGNQSRSSGRGELRERPAPKARRERLEQDAREDPVVQEFVRTLKTDVAEVRPLDPQDADDA